MFGSKIKTDSMFMHTYRSVTHAGRVNKNKCTKRLNRAPASLTPKDKYQAERSEQFCTRFGSTSTRLY